MGSYPGVGHQQVPHRVALALLLFFQLHGDVPVGHGAVGGPVLGALLLGKHCRRGQGGLWCLLGLAWMQPGRAFTWPLSSSSVSITMEQDFHSQIILQKSSIVCCSGPWLAM